MAFPRYSWWGSTSASHRKTAQSPSGRAWRRARRPRAARPSGLSEWAAEAPGRRTRPRTLGCPGAVAPTAQRVRTVPVDVVRAPERFAWRAPKDCAETGSCAHHLDIVLTSRGAQAQDLALAPTIGSGQKMHVREGALCPVVERTPKIGHDVEQYAPSVRAYRAVQADLQIGPRILRRHVLGKALDHSRR